MKCSQFWTTLRTSVVFSAVSVSMLLLGCDGEDDSPFADDFDSQEEYLAAEAEDQHIVALSALTFSNEDIVEEALLGVADLDSEAALTSDHTYLLASVSKMVTGVALLQLIDDGLASLDDPIDDHLDFSVSAPGTRTAITFRMLLTHTSGIADGDAIDDEYHTGVDSPKALGDFLKGYFTPGGEDYNASQNFHGFEPGSAHEYSNVGSALVGYLVERLSGQPFDAYCRTEIFEPLGMRRSFWRLARITGPSVSLYDWDGDENQLVAPYSFTDYPNGGLRSTARDMQRFLLALAHAYAGTDTRLLNQATAQAMMSPQIPALDATVGLHAFLLDAETNVWGHDGGESGTATYVGLNPSSGQGAVLLANQGEAELEDVFAELIRYL